MDIDAATMSKAMKVLGHEYGKWSDIGHTKNLPGKSNIQIIKWAQDTDYMYHTAFSEMFFVRCQPK